MSITRASAWRSSAAARSAGLSRRHHRAARLALGRRLQARSASRTCSSALPPATWTRWSTATRRTADPQRRRLHAGRRRRQAAGSRVDRLRAARAARRSSDVPIVIGGIEASLRRIAHYDYWSDKVRRSMLLDAKADLLVYGNAERQIVEIAHRLAARRADHEINDLRGTAFVAPRRRTTGSRSIRRGRRTGPCRATARSVRDAERARASDPGDRREAQPRVDPRRRRTARPRHAPSRCCAFIAGSRRRQRRSRTQRDPPALVRTGEARTRCSTHTHRASSTSSRTPATRARSCSGTVTSTSGSTRRRSR